MKGEMFWLDGDGTLWDSKEELLNNSIGDEEVCEVVVQKVFTVVETSALKELK
jgi:hypothetical protein